MAVEKEQENGKRSRRKQLQIPTGLEGLRQDGTKIQTSTPLLVGYLEHAQRAFLPQDSFFVLSIGVSGIVPVWLIVWLLGVRLNSVRITECSRYVGRYLRCCCLMTLVPRNQRVGDEIWGNKGISEQGGGGGGGGFKANPLDIGHVFLGMRSARGTGDIRWGKKASTFSIQLLLLQVESGSAADTGRNIEPWQQAAASRVSVCGAFSDMREKVAEAIAWGPSRRQADKISRVMGGE